uniref:Armadillo repeat-containing domain-containing protein n=1 Tax=Romanomermis culicivorax TaxID=13658 RepID=A0A915JLV4_ROMCU
MLILNTQFIFSVFNHNTAWSSFYTNALKLLPHQKWPASKKALCLISSVAGLGAASYLIVRYYFDKRKKKNDLFVEEEEENITGADENQCCISGGCTSEYLKKTDWHPGVVNVKIALHGILSYSRLSCSSGGDTLKLEDGDMDSSSSNTKIPESRSTLDSRISDCSVNTFSNRNNHRFKKVIIKSRTDDRVVISSQENGKINGFSHQEYQNSLMETLNALYGTNKLINNKEAKHLICILQQKNEETILKVLTTICNLAAFTANQDLFRLNGALPLLVELLDDCQLDSSVRLMLTQCLGNMAVNTKNNPYLQRAVAKIVESYSSPECSELQKIISIQTLTNLSVEILPRHVKDFAASIRTTLDRLMTSSGPNLACLKFLINLSCCTTLASKILFSEAPYDFADILNTDSSEDVIIRSLTLLSHLFNTKETLNLSSGYDFEKNHHRSSSELQECNNEQGTICSILFDDDILRSEIRGRLEKLKEKYSKKSNEEISQKIDRLLKTKNVD